jgi:hypothetical protein
MMLLVVRLPMSFSERSPPDCTLQAPPKPVKNGKRGNVTRSSFFFRSDSQVFGLAQLPLPRPALRQQRFLSC